MVGFGMHILAFGFLSPWLMAAGAAATSIPIIIHLLNKRKFRVVMWAAMEWLLAAQRRNARRLKFQRWLLLAVRCLAILMIAAGIAQVVLQSTAFGSILGGRRVSVIVWDDSYSMGFDQSGGGGTAGQTAFEKSRRLLADYVASLRSDDEVLLIRGSTGGVAFDASGKPSADHQAILSQIASAKLSDGGTDLPGAFDRARQVLADVEKSARSRQLLLISDASNSSIHDPKRGNGADNQIEGAGGDKLKKAAQGAAAHATEFRVVDEGVEGQWNLAVTSLMTHRPMVVAGIASDLELEVFNASDQPRVDQAVNLLIDGVLARTVKIPRIEPGSFQTAQATVTLPTIGRHLLEAQLPADQLPVDDTRQLMLNVRKEIPVLLVDGSPGDSGHNSYGSTFYLYAAYALPGEAPAAVTPGSPTPRAATAQGSTFAPKVISELELPNTPLDGYDVIVLSDSGDPGPAIRENLRTFVKNGGLLMIFPGNRTSTQRMNEALGERGANLLPATLGQPIKLQSADQISAGIAFAPEGFQKNPVMQVFGAADREGKNVGFKTVETTEYLKLGVPSDGSAETILRYQQKDRTAGDAAVVMKRGAGADSAKGGDNSLGNVILFASSADMAWNTWGAKPSFLPFIHELTYYGLARGTADAGAGLTLDVGQPLVLPGDASTAGPWIAPHDQQISVSQEIRNGRSVLSSTPLKYAGVYGPAAGDTRSVVAVNPEAREADIRHVSREQLAAALGIEAAAVLPHPAKFEWASGNENLTISWLGPKLIIAALALFMLEALLALKFSSYR